MFCAASFFCFIRSVCLSLRLFWGRRCLLRRMQKRVLVLVSRSACCPPLHPRFHSSSLVGHHPLPPFCFRRTLDIVVCLVPCCKAGVPLLVHRTKDLMFAVDIMTALSEGTPQVCSNHVCFIHVSSMPADCLLHDVPAV